MDTIEKIYRYLLDAGMTPAGAAGAMGNIQAESAFKVNNVEDRCPLSDEDYTLQVDSGLYGDERWANDAYGYGLTQLTYHTRKRAFLAFVRQRGVSISDLDSQLAFMVRELKNDFPAVWRICCTTSIVSEASDAFMRKFENPADQSARALAYRAGLGIDIYERFSGRQEPDQDLAVVYGAEYVLRPHLLGLDCKGPEVEALQLLLRAWGYDPGDPSGTFTEETRSAAAAFQQAAGLTADGIVGHDTMTKLLGLD